MTLNWAYGLKYAQADWTVFLGDDDVYFKESGKLLSYAFLDTKCSALKFKSIPFIWSNYNSSREATDKINVFESRVDPTHCLPKPKTFWWKDQPRNFPTANANSPIKTSLLKDLKKKEAILNGISPDWQIGAAILNRQICFQNYDCPIAGSGISEFSSVSLLVKKPTATSQIRITNYFESEKKLNKKILIHNSLRFYDSNFPTVWLSKVDSLIRGRESSGRTTWQIRLVGLWDSFDTTPHFTYKVLFYYLKKAQFLGLVFFPFAVTRSLIKILIKKIKIQQ
jgi:hypothetical protein